MSEQQQQKLVRLNTLRTLIEKPDSRQAIIEAVPESIKPMLTFQRIHRTLFFQIRKTPEILWCDPMSVLEAVSELAQLGFEPGGPRQLAHLLPFRNNGKKTYELKVVIGYRGIIELLYRAPQILDVRTYVRHEKDYFEIEHGVNPVLIHRPHTEGHPGDWNGAYCVVYMKDNIRHPEYMRRDEIEDIRKRCSGPNSSAWQLWPGEMARKTVLRRASKNLPQSIELMHALSLEDDDFGQEPEPDVVSVTSEPAPTRADELASMLEGGSPIVNGNASQSIVDPNPELEPVDIDFTPPNR